MAFAMPFAPRRPSPRARALLVRMLPALLLGAGALLLTQPWRGAPALGAAGAGPSAPGIAAPIDLRGAARGLEPATLAGALLVVGGLLFFLPSVARRLAPGVAGRGKIAVVEQRPLGGRKSLLLVEVAGRRLLIGASEHGLATLAELPDETRETRASVGFPRALDQALAERVA